MSKPPTLISYKKSKPPISYKKQLDIIEKRKDLILNDNSHLDTTYCIECGNKTLNRYYRKSCDRCLQSNMEFDNVYMEFDNV